MIGATEWEIRGSADLGDEPSTSDTSGSASSASRASSDRQGRCRPVKSLNQACTSPNNRPQIFRARRGHALRPFVHRVQWIPREVEQQSPLGCTIRTLVLLDHLSLLSSPPKSTTTPPPIQVAFVRRTTAEGFQDSPPAGQQLLSAFLPAPVVLALSPASPTPAVLASLSRRPRRFRGLPAGAFDTESDSAAAAFESYAESSRPDEGIKRCPRRHILASPRSRTMQLNRAFVTSP